MGLPRSRLNVLLLGLLVTAMGLTPMLAALDVIPSPESSFHAPRWIVFLAGSLFFMVGMWILMQGIVGYGALLMNFIALRALAGWLSGKSFFGNRAGRALERISEWGVVLLLFPLVLLAFLLQGLQGASARLVARLRGKPREK